MWWPSRSQACSSRPTPSTTTILLANSRFGRERTVDTSGQPPTPDAMDPQPQPQPPTAASTAPRNPDHGDAHAGRGASAGEDDVLAPQVARAERTGLEEGVRGRERCPALEPATPPVRRGGDRLDLERVAEAGVAALLERPHDLVAVAR